MAAYVSTQEHLDFGSAFYGAPADSAGIFRVADMAPPGRADRRWALRLIKNRDTSDLQEKAVTVAAADSLSAVIVDGTSSSPRLDGERGSPLRTVSVFADGAHHRPLISLARRDEQTCEAWSSLSAEMLDEAWQLMRDAGMDLVAVPVISLEPELATPADRCRFVREGTPYAIKVDGKDRFRRRLWTPDDPLDSFDPDTVEHLFALRPSSLDPGQPSVVPIRDLDDRGTAGAVAFEEFLFRFQGSAGPEYFLARDALPPGVKAVELLDGTARLARMAAGYASSSPAEALRLHEFQHPHEEPYCAAVRIVDRCRYLDGLGKDGPIA
ncbi:MAG TPA: hypothetical protein VMH33_14045 [Solirubrobacterales bacterium]|nr:hypothetical protein [Solirubrobacterales bacterium]